MFDIVVKNGLVIDGTGRPGVRADVGIVGDRVVALGELDSSAERIIVADGCVVSPGFIDIHAHTDELVIINPTCESKLTQGVTTEVSGHCGCSPAPRGGLRDDGTVEVAECGVERDWRTMAEYFSRIESVPLSINVAGFVGHGTIRATAMGYDAREPSADEMAEMRRLVAEAMEAGALGLSTGLIYPPGCYSATEEITDLCRIVAEYGGIYATHMRSEGDGLIEATEEALRIGRESGTSVQIAHHKAVGQRNWGKVNTTLAMIDEARAEGLDVWADQYPYLGTATSLRTMLPDWAHDGGNPAMLARLNDPVQRGRLSDELLRSAEDGWIADTGGWETVVIGFVGKDENRFCEGLSIDEIALRVRKRPVDVVLDLLLEEGGSVGMMHFVINEQDLITVMKHPAVIVGSDATARSVSGPLSSGKPHPRAFGTFARVLGKYAREDGVLSLDEAVAKMTGRTARRLGLQGRGILATDCYADITIFDPTEIADTATFAEPHSHAQGIRYVLVNGKVVLDEGQVIKGLPAGRVLRR